MSEIEVPVDGAAVYAVHATYFGGGTVCPGGTFANAGAFSRANAEFERLAADAGVLELTMIRTDASGSPHFVARQGRHRPGEPLQDLSFDAPPLEDPTDDDQPS